MFAMLAGVPGKLKTLLDRLTATRAGLLDNLNATVSSRMPGTTTERDRIDTTISSRMPGTTTHRDRIDTTISSRAPASSALSNATWTNPRAAKLDDILASCIKSRQTGFISTNSPSSGSGEDTRYVDTTITSVNANKCLIFFDGHYVSGSDNLAESTRINGGSTNQFRCFARLTSSTNLRVSTAASGSPQAITGRWTVIEFF